MSKATGKNVPISLFRRLVTDLMYFSRQVPAVTIERRMDLATIAEARACCSPRPSWTALFTKAFALVARDHPQLRQSYLKFPWPRLYEHPHNIATVNIERELPGERIILYCLIRSPENRSLPEIDGIIRVHKEAPLEQLRSYQRAVATSRLPWPIRQFFWWGSLNFFGRRRCHNFGTYGLTTVAAEGAGVLRVIPLLTSTLHYGLFDEQWRLDMRMSFDHRVLDGVLAARLLVALEKTLNNEILAELHDLRLAKAA